MKGSDEIMGSTLFLGTYPGLTDAMLDHEIKVIRFYVQSFSTELLSKPEQ